MRTGHDVVCRECGRVLATGRSTCPLDGAKTVRRPRALAGSVLAERYRLDRVVGRGGFATVYRAHDLLENTDVAVKVLSPDLRADARSVQRFIAEGQTLAGLHHPHVVTVLDCGQSGPWVFLVLELLEGRALSDEIVRRAPRDPARAVRVALQICEGLGAVHDRGLVHRDLKPDNVLLTGSRDLWAKVSDFGIAHSLLEDAPRARFAGTPAYASPEQGRGDALDGRSDLYALGLILYEMLCGEPPFPREASAATLLRRIREPPPDIRVKLPELPGGLRAAVAKLLATKAADRPRNAAEAHALLAAHDGGTVCVLEPTEVDDFRFEPLDYAPPLCGRDREIAELLPFVDRLGDYPHASVLMLAGASGVGKSQLASRLADLAREKRGALRYHREGGDLGRSLCSLADIIEDLLCTRELEAAKVEQRLGELLGDAHGAHELCSILRPGPVETPAGAPAAAAPGDYRSHVVLEALARLAALRPLAIVLDDTHAADALTRDVLAHIPIWSRDRGKGLLFIATWTTGAGGDPPADLARERFAERARVTSVAPLDEQGSETLLRRIGTLDADARRLIGRLGAGNPLALLQLVRHFANEKLLLPTRLGWRLAPRTRFDLSIPSGIGALGTRHLDQLRARDGAGAPAADLLERLALIGERAPHSVLCGLLEHEGRPDLLAQIEVLLDLLVAEGLIHRADGAIRFAHGLVREAIAERASEHPNAARLHTAIGEALLATGDDEKTVRAAAFHLFRGGEADRALPLVMSAASLARSIGDAPRASEDYLLALRILERQRDPDVSCRREVELGLGETMLTRGQTRQAEEHFMKALEISDGPEVRHGLGCVAEVKGDYASGLDHLSRAEQLYLSEGRVREAAEASITLGRVLRRTGDFPAARERLSQASRVLSNLGDDVGAARAQTTHGAISLFTGDYQRGLELLTAALPVLEACGNPLLLGDCLSAIGSIYSEMRHHGTAIEWHRRAQAELERAGLLRGVDSALGAIGSARAYLGAYDEGQRLLEAALRLAEDADHDYGVSYCLGNLGWLCRLAGKLEESMQWLASGLARLKDRPQSLSQSFTCSEMGHTLLQRGSLDEAAAAFRRALAVPDVRADVRAECEDGLRAIESARRASRDPNPSRKRTPKRPGPKRRGATPRIRE